MFQSPPCRVVMLTAKALELDIKKITLKLRDKEHLKPEFLKINPQHTVPTLVDGDLVLWESRAIVIYLADAYDKNNILYPRDPKIRAKINFMLFFDFGTLYAKFREYFRPVAFNGEQPNAEKLRALNEALGFFNNFLDGHDFAVGNSITIADHSLVTSVSTMNESGIDISEFANIVAWYERCKSQMPGYETENGLGARELGAFIKSKLPQDSA